MNEPRISVIVPVYNAQYYLNRCLDSLQNQIYSNLEFILVDDGSSDNSGNICDRYAASDDRFQVIHRENGGAAAARNDGLDAATGEWVGFVDSDDYIEPDMYAYLWELAQHNHADIVQCGVLWEENGKQKICDSEHPAKSFEISKSIPKQLWNNFSNFCNNKIFRTERVKMLRFNGKYLIGEDLLFNLQALNLSDCIVLGERAGYHYVQHENSICHRPVKQDTIESMRNMLLFAEKTFASRRCLAEFCRDQRMNNNFDICSKLVCADKTSEYAELIATIRKEMRLFLRSGYFTRKMTKKEKVKCVLIGYGWHVYRFGLPRWKSWKQKKDRV